MSRIFAAVAVGVALLGGAAAISAAIDESGSEADAFDPIAEFFSTGLELGILVPLALIIGLLLATLGVMARL